MSEQAVADMSASPPPGSESGGGQSMEEQPPKPYPMRVLLATVSRRGAQLGLFWIAIIAVAAIFAPLLANTHPLLMKADGQLSSPMLEHATVADISLLLIFLAGLIIMPLPMLTWKRRFQTLTGVSAVIVLLAAIFVRPPQVVVFSEYREAEAAGEIEWAIRAPIPYSPSDRQRDHADPRLKDPSLDHWMGTTSNGADLMSNMLWATRIAISIGFIATGIAVVLGIFIGGLMGYFSGIVDLLGMRLVEIFSAIPQLLLLLAIVASIPPAYRDYMLYLIMVVIGLTGWVGYALYIRAEFLRLRKQEFVQAAEALGLPLWSILFRHMLPNGVAPVLVSASFGVAGAILLESTLSFLGIGLVSEASWGKLLNQARSVGGTFYWWIALYPGLAIFLTVFAYNLIGEALRDAIDPHMAQKI